LQEKVLTGSLELDSLLDGGFLSNSMILLAGNPGTGKTILAAQFIYAGATKYGDRGVYVCFSEPKRDLIQRMQAFDMNFEDLISSRMVSILDLTYTTETDIQSAINQIFEELVNTKARRLVIDSITALFVGLKSEIEKKFILRLIYKVIQKSNSTTILTMDKPWSKRTVTESIEEFASDGIILLENLYNEKGVLERHLRIPKMRGTNHTRNTHIYHINSKKGLEIKI